MLYPKDEHFLFRYFVNRFVPLKNMKGLGRVSANNIIVLIIIVCAAVALTVILMVSSRSMHQKTSQKPTRQEFKDPVTQPIRISVEKSMANPLTSATSISNPDPSIAYARLIRLSEDKMITTTQYFYLIKKSGLYDW